MIQVIDSHTCGEPTRVIIKGGPDLGKGPLGERARLLETEYADFCRSVLREPRGYDAMVGVLLVAPVNKDCLTGAKNCLTGTSNCQLLGSGLQLLGRG